MSEEEAYAYVMRYSTTIVKFLLENMTDPVEHVRMSVLKAIEFILDMIGCSLGDNFIMLLQKVIETYPHATSKYHAAQSEFFTVQLEPEKAN
jgi:hypothetical protein